MKFIKFAFLLTAISLFIFACTQSNNSPATVNNANKPINAPTPPAQPTATAPADEMASARKIYTDMCSRCHKDDGSGGKTEIEGETINAENLRSDKMKKMADEKYVDYIKNGIPDEGMPAFKDKLTDEQIKDVIKFIRTEFQGK